jgi:hypothetical protein
LIRVRDIWDPGEKRFLSAGEIRRITKSKNLDRIRDEVVDSLPLSGVPVQKGHWLALNEPCVQQEFFHVQDVIEDEIHVHTYVQESGSSKLYKMSRQTELLDNREVTAARVCTRSWAGTVVAINSKVEVPGHSTWTIGDGKVVNLTFDPGEWTWKRAGAIKLGHFYSYTTKRGYRYIIDRQKKQSPFDKIVEDMGYSIGERKRFYLKLWHPRVQRKISSMIWVTGSGGLPLAYWRCVRKIKPTETGLCDLCNTGHMQTSEHAFLSCPSVKEVWDRYYSLRSLLLLPVRPRNIHEILTGLDPPVGPNPQTDSFGYF